MEILLVGDGFNNSLGLKKKLQENNFSVDFSEIGDNLIKKLREKKIKIVLATLKHNKEQLLDHFLNIIESEKIYVLGLLDCKNLLKKDLELKLFKLSDFVILPSTDYEILLRIKKIISTKIAMESVVEKDGLKIDSKNYEMFILGEKEKAAPKEIELLFKMVSNENKLFTRDQLLDEVWGYQYLGATRTVDVHIKRLRAKLKKISDKFEIKTVWGAGYVFKSVD